MMNDNLPSVTQIISPYVDFSMVPSYILDPAKERGNKTHAICAGICQGLWIPSIPRECDGYITSFHLWFDRYVEEVIFSERKLVDPVYGFTGQPDFYGRVRDGNHILVDWKTPFILYKAWKIQVGGGYKRLIEVAKKPLDRVGSLQLDPNGGIPKMTWYKNDPADFNIFLGLLNAHNYFHGG